ncbi:MAG: hypothetical protein DHS20C18_16040 [Saprospiraceae bacterium]|nr:MAG: hypothetical protein DHS20C18_16040 [Saprospiraceae bacterium]
MLTNLNKYRHLLLSLLLVSYILSAFPKPLFETLHILAHAAEIIQTTYHQHAFHAHGDDHHHYHLEVADAHKQQTDQQEQNAPLTDIKKKTEISCQIAETACVTTKKAAQNFEVLVNLKTIYCDLISPPPQDVA